MADDGTPSMAEVLDAMRQDGAVTAMPRGEDPVPAPVAYCAPGMKWAAALALLHTDPGAEVIEHPYMANRKDIILTSPGTPFPPGPDPHDVERLRWALLNPERWRP